MSILQGISWKTVLATILVIMAIGIAFGRRRK